MRDKRRKHRDFIQNMAITVLAVSAVLLFAQTQIYSLGSGTDFFRILSGTNQSSGQNESGETFVLSAPMRVAVSGPYGRYGSVTSNSGSDENLRSLLREVLGSAGTDSPCTYEEFAAGLKGTSIYYDFLYALPLSILAELADAKVTDATPARSLLVASAEEQVSLYIWDGGETYLRCSTAIPPKSLEDIVGQYELGNAAFAADLVESDPHAEALFPYSLLPSVPPALPVLRCQVPAHDDTLLLAALGFNPNTKNRYPETNGTEVIVDSGRTLRLLTDGSIRYSSTKDATLSIDAAGEIPTLPEAVSGAGALLNKLLSSTDSEGTLYLKNIRQNGNTTEMTFGYQADGVPIRFSDGGSAAQVTLSGTTVSFLTLRLRQYTATEDLSLLLPLRQALSIASIHPGAELSVGYADNGSGTVEASWLAD